MKTVQMNCLPRPFTGDKGTLEAKQGSRERASANANANAVQKNESITHTPTTTRWLLAVALVAALIVLPNPANAKVKDTTKVVATWVAPTNGSVVTAPATIVLSVDAEAKQVNQPIVSVEFFNGATLIGSRTTASSGLNYQVIWPNVSPGTYSLTATATNDKGDFDTTNPVTITVIKANQSIGGFSPQTPITYAPNTSFTLIATGGASGNQIIFASTTPAICTVSGNTVTIQSAGTCTITADQAGSINYNPAPQVTAAITINKANQTITGFNPASPITYAPGATFTLTATGGASGNPVSFASVTPAVCSVAGSVATIQSAGTCTLTADQAGNSNYNAPTQVTASVTINKANQSITGFNPSSPITYANGGTFTLAAMGGASGNPVIFVSTSPAVCSVNGNVATMLSAGTCTLTADQAGNNNYNAAAQVMASVTINRANQSITGFTPSTPIIYVNGGSFTLSASGGASGNAVTFTSTTPSVCTVNGNVVSIVAVGICTLKADQAGNANYNTAITVTATVVINKTAQAITGFSPASPVNLAVGGTFTLSATGGASGNPVSFTSSTAVVCTTGGVNNATVTVVSAGTCTLTANQPGDATYNAATPVSATVFITVLAAEAQLYYVHADHLGTPRAITRPSDNAVVWRWDNTDPFGANLPNENPSGLGTFTCNLRLPGQYYDVETGTNYNRFRDYDSIVGRYIQSDPIGLKGGINTYAYTRSNPVAKIDPYGLYNYWPANPLLNTVICDGEGGIIPQIESGITPLNKKCLGDCIEEHEKNHIKDLLAIGSSPCANKAKDLIVTFDNDAQLKASELASFNVEINCVMAKAMTACADCMPTIAARVKQLQKDKKKYE